MAGRKKVDKVDITISQGSRGNSSNNRSLDRGVYSRFQIIKRNDKAKSVSAQIEITDGTDDLVSRSAVEAYDRTGGEFMKSMAPIDLLDDTEITVNIILDEVATQDCVYQILFFKKTDCDD
jgi:hypothetical protein